MLAAFKLMKLTAKHVLVGYMGEHPGKRVTDTCAFHVQFSVVLRNNYSIVCQLLSAFG
jgi:hypothetical protein